MSDVLQKRCPSCPEGQQWHPATPKFFHRDKQKSDGLTSRCRECRNAYWMTPEGQEQRQEYLSRPGIRQHYRELRQAYYQIPEYREQQLASQRDRQRCPENQEHRREYQRTYQHRPGGREQQRDYRQQPKERERSRINSHLRRARKRDVPGTHTAAQIQEQLKRQKYRCYYTACGHAKFKKIKGRYVYHIDHTFPLSRVAGSDIPANDISYLVLTCPDCNLSKGDKFPWEWPEGGRLL